jgi:hypothetical protein
LNRRQLRERLLHHRREQIADGCERDLCLGMGRARRQGAEAALAREPIALLPERGLADPRIALEQQCLPARGHSLQKRLERQQLLAPANHLGCHRTLPAGDRAHARLPPHHRLASVRARIVDLGGRLAFGALCTTAVAPKRR